MDIFNTKRLQKLNEDNFCLEEALADAEDYIEKLEFWQDVRGSIHRHLDPSPTEPGKRQSYVANMAGFYDSGFEKQLEHMICEWEEQAGRFGTNEERTLFIRATINILLLFKEFGNKMKSEHRGYIQQKSENNQS